MDPPSPHVLIARIAAAVLVLLFVFGFVFALLMRGYDLNTALIAAVVAGVVAAEITHRLLGAWLPPSGPRGRSPA
jgi:hypothetical protein